MAYITPYQYYYNSGNIPESLNWGKYQYVPLKDIVANFLLYYTGNHSLINNEGRRKVVFFAKRGIQELNYDAMKEIKVLLLPIYEELRFILPSDYVNWVRISVYKDGKLFPLSENTQAMSALTYLLDNNNKILFDQNGYALSPQHSSLDYDRIYNGEMGVYNSNGGMFDGLLGYLYRDGWFFSYPVGGRYGLDTAHANINPKFTIDNKGGVINFFSDMQGETCVLEYVSDGIENGMEEKIAVNKLFEEYLYAFIKESILENKLGVQEYIITRTRKKKGALLMNAKIRAGGMHPAQLLMTLRGMDKTLK